MRYYKENYVIDALNEAVFPEISAKEYMGRNSEYKEYALFANKIYSKEDIANLHEEEKDIIIDNGRCVTEDWLSSAVKEYIIHHQEIIDNNSNLELEQKEILKLLLKCDMFYMPLHLINLGDMYVADKIDITLLLLNTKWEYDCCYAELYENIYMLTISFNENQKKGDIIKGYNKDEELFKDLEVYIPYITFLNIYRIIYNNQKTDMIS